jgi:large subunit ribosomal protein L25
MAVQIDLIAEAREDSGKGASRRLRRAGKVPAIVYGGGREPRAVAFDRELLMHKMASESFFSSVLNVKIGKNTRQCILKAVQMHPAKRLAMHLDLQRIVADELIRMTVPIHFLNEDEADGVKQGGGSVAHLVTEVEVSCLPANLPEYLEIDIEHLVLDDTLMLSDIKLPEGVEILELANDNDRSIVSIHIIKEIVIEDELEEGELEEGEVEGEVEGEGEEGATPAEPGADESKGGKDE